MITGGEVQYVDVEIAGRRSDLKELSNTTLEAVADVGRIDGPGTYEISWTLDPPSTVATGDIKLVSSSSNKIKVKISEYKERTEIPIQIEYRGNVAEGYVRDAAVTNQETVSVSGPAEEIDKIACARIIVELGNTQSTVDRDLEYLLIGENGEPLTVSKYVTMEDPIVRVMVPVHCYKQINLELEIIPGGGAGVADVTYTIEPSVIGVIGDEDVLAELPSTLILKTIKLAELKEDLYLTVVPELPTGVKIRDRDNLVRISLNMVGMTTRTIYVHSDQIIRENDDGKLLIEDTRIPVTVRGRTDVIHSLSADMIKIVADMTNDFDSNNMTVSLDVSVIEGVDAGILGKYSISVIDSSKDSR